MHIFSSHSDMLTSENTLRMIKKVFFGNESFFKRKYKAHVGKRVAQYKTKEKQNKLL